MAANWRLSNADFIVPNLVLRPGIGPKSVFADSLTARFRGASKLVRQSYRQIDNATLPTSRAEANCQDLLARRDVVTQKRLVFNLEPGVIVKATAYWHIENVAAISWDNHMGYVSLDDLPASAYLGPQEETQQASPAEASSAIATKPTSAPTEVITSSTNSWIVTAVRKYLARRGAPADIGAPAKLVTFNYTGQRTVEGEKMFAAMLILNMERLHITGYGHEIISFQFEN